MTEADEICFDTEMCRIIIAALPTVLANYALVIQLRGAECYMMGSDPDQVTAAI